MSDLIGFGDPNNPSQGFFPANGGTPTPGGGAAPGQPEEPKEEIGFVDTALDVAAAVPMGVRDAAQETVDFGVDIVDWADNHTFDVLEDGTPDYLTLPDYETKTAAGQMVRGISQFAAGFVGAGKFMKAAGWLQKGSSMVRGAAQGALTDFVAFDPHEERLSNLVQEFPALANPISDYLAASDDDSALEGRFKNAVEGIGLGAATDVLFKTLKGIKNWRSVRGTADEARVLHEAATEIDEAATKYNNPEPKPETIEIEGRVDDEIVDGTTVELTPEGQIAERAKVDLNRDAFDHKLYEELRAKNQGMSRSEIIEEYGDKLLNLSKAEGEEGMFGVMRSVLDTIDDAKMLKNQEGGWKAAEKELADLGDAFGYSPEQIMTNMSEMADAMRVDPVKMTLAAKNLANSMAHQIKNLEKSISANLEPGVKIADVALDAGHSQSKQVLKLLKMREDLAFLARNIGDVRTASARVTASGAANNRPTITWAMIEHGNKATHKEVLEKLNIPPQNLDRYLRAIRMADKGDVRALFKLSSLDLTVSKWDMHNEYWINALLSGPTTHMVNLTSGLLKTAITPATKMIGSFAFKDAETRNTILMEGGRAYIGMWKAMKDSLSMARRAWKLEENVLDPMHKVMDAPTHAISADAIAANRNAKMFQEVLDSTPQNQIAAGIRDNFNPIKGEDIPFHRAIDALGKIVRLPSRALLSGDEFLKQINYRADRYSKLYTEGYKRFDGDADKIARYIEENFDASFGKADPKTGIKEGQGLNPRALQYAREATWTQDLGYGLQKGESSIGQWMQEGAAKHPGVRLITPFIRTPVNIARDFWHHTPALNRLSKHYRAEIAAGGERAAIARGKEAVGGMILGMGAMLAYNGMITGNAPKDYRMRDTMPKGWQPLSIKIGNTYVSYARLEPFSMMLGMVADYANIAENVSDMEREDAAAAMMTAMYKNVASKTYLRGIIDLMDVISEQNVEMTERWLNGRAAAYLPFSGLLGQTRKVADPEMREVSGFLDTLKNKVPGLSDTLPARRNWITGEAKEFSPGWAIDNISPYPMADGKKDFVFDELHKLNYAFTPPSKRVSKNVELNAEQLSRLHELTGTVRIGRYNMYQRLERLMKSRAYDIKRQKYGDGPADYKGRRVEMVMHVMRQYKAAAKRQLYKEFPDLGRQVAQDKRNAYMVKKGRNERVEDLFNLN